MALQQRCRNCSRWLQAKATRCKCGFKVPDRSEMVWRVDREDGHGHRFREVIGSYEQAFIVDAAVIHAKRMGESYGVRPELTTLATLRDEYLKEPQVLAMRDFKQRRNYIKLAIRELGELRTMRGLSPQEAHRYQRRRERDGVSGSTINRELRYLSIMLDWFAAIGRIHANPIKGYRQVAENEARERIASAEELAAMAEVLPDQYRPLVELLAALPLRSHEAAELRWQEGDGKQPWLDVTQEGKGFVVIPRGFSKSGRRRDVPVYYPELMRKLAALPSRFARGHVFMQPWGAPITLTQFGKDWRKFRGKAGCSDLHIHDLKHTAITWLLLHGVPAHDVAYCSDHASATIQQRYANLQREHMRTTRDKWYNPATGLIESLEKQQEKAREA